MPAKGENKWESDAEYIELMNFLIEKTKDAKSSMNILQLAEEFKENNVSSQSTNCLRQRISTLRSKIHRMDSIDTAAKVKMLFALGASIDEDFLNELRKDAVVDVDGKNRIIKYRANDGSLELEGDHSRSAKRRVGWKQKMMEGKKSQEDSDDESVGTPLPRTPESTKRSAAAEMPNSVKRTRNSSSDDSAEIPVPRDREVVRRFSPSPLNSRVQQCPQPKIAVAAEVPNSSEMTMNSSLGRLIKNEEYTADDIEDSQSSTDTNAPITGIETAPIASRAPASHTSQDSSTGPVSGADDAQTPQIKFIEAIQFIVLNLDMPSLSPLQEKIDKMLRESSNAKIPNDEMILAMETLVTKITNRSVSILSETVESVSLKVFLCYLKAAILNSKLEGLETLMEKLKERINEPASNDKNIPLDKVISVLQYSLDGIGF